MSEALLTWLTLRVVGRLLDVLFASTLRNKVLVADSTVENIEVHCADHVELNVRCDRVDCCGVSLSCDASKFNRRLVLYTCGCGCAVCASS